MTLTRKLYSNDRKNLNNVSQKGPKLKKRLDNEKKLTSLCTSSMIVVHFCVRVVRVQAHLRRICLLALVTHLVFIFTNLFRWTVTLTDKNLSHLALYLKKQLDESYTYTNSQHYTASARGEMWYGRWWFLYESISVYVLQQFKQGVWEFYDIF